MDTLVGGAPVEIAAEPRIRVGVADGDRSQEFNGVVSPFLMEDGRLVVPVMGDGTIRIFDASGVHVTTVGGEGNGPGEFRSLSAAWARGDTIEALDSRLRRITRFMPDGSVGVVDIQVELPDLSFVAGPLRDGWLVSGVAAAGPGGVGRDRVAFHHIARDGTDLGELAVAGGFIRYRAGNFGGPEPMSPRPLGALQNDHVYIGESDRASIIAYDADGMSVDSITWAANVADVPASLLRAVIDSAVARVPADRQPNTRARLEAGTQTGALSLYWKMMVDSDGFIWIRPYDPFVNSFAAGAQVGPGGSWRVFAPNGEETTSVQVPPDIEPFRITSDAVIGIARDADGVESVRVHALRRVPT